MVSATEFKAKCLSLLHEVEESGAAITVTRRGHPIAVLGPASKGVSKSPRDSWAGRARIAGDIVNSDTSDLWEAVCGKQAHSPDAASLVVTHVVVPRWLIDAKAQSVTV